MQLQESDDETNESVGYGSVCSQLTLLLHSHQYLIDRSNFFDDCIKYVKFYHS